ncbi:protein takeout-like [Harmonia axyridis]|uniref:protein takeout-like n=1 Tax=Harmonia axyridis TaxID=115357 RepID=UPI001E278647|nr:protein takeout-like [Harmonia axyridis]
MWKVVIGVIFCFSTVCGLHLPKYIEPCSPESPNFSECAIQHGSGAIAFLVKGDKAYGIPSFTPFKVTFVSVDANGLKMNLSNGLFSGIENLKLNKYSLDQENKKIYTTLTGPLILFEFDLSTGGKLANLPIDGDGHGWTKIYNGNFSHNYEYSVVEKNGKHYLQFGKDEVIIEPGSMEWNIQGLFNGNKQLGDSLNSVLNENWKELLQQFGPVISEVYGSIAKEVLRKLYDRIPIEEIYPGMKV